MYIFRVLAYKTRRYHLIKCEDMKMLSRICAERFRYEIVKYSTGKIELEPNWSIIHIDTCKGE